MKEQFTKEHCKLAIDACQRLAALPQHPMSAAFWRGMERLWRERLNAVGQAEGETGRDISQAKDSAEPP